MKRPSLAFLSAISSTLILAACDRRPHVAEAAPPATSTPTAPAPPAAPVTLDAAKLRKTLASAGPEEQSRAGKAAQAIEAEAYPAALDTLEKLLAEGHLTPEQKNLVTSYIAQLKQAKKQKP
ncbi:MAG: hypothetical protein ABIP20_13895 [Chthoniobacteraceae bacterium]